MLNVDASKEILKGLNLHRHGQVVTVKLPFEKDGVETLINFNVTFYQASFGDKFYKVTTPSETVYIPVNVDAFNNPVGK